MNLVGDRYSSCLIGNKTWRVKANLSRSYNCYGIESGERYSTCLIRMSTSDQ